MPIVKVGYRRLYDSIGCSIVNDEIFHIVFSLGEHLSVEIYMGNRPTFGIAVETGHEDYIVPGTQTTLGHFSYHGDATESSYPRKFFTEIVCLREIDISADLYEAFSQNKEQANNELLQLAARDEEEYRLAADFMSGVIGLRYQPQFVLKLLNENIIAFCAANRAINNRGSAIRILEIIQFSETGIEQLKLLFPALGSVTDELAQSTGKILGWLLRAWSEKDAVAKFNALFIPLEMILEGIRGELPQEQLVQIGKLRDLIVAYGGEDEEQLSNCLDRLVNSQRPSLIDRFAIFAREANMPQWENDVEAFRRFNRIRNGLIHRGDARVRLHVPIGEETRALEDLTERYVNFALFSDTAIYASAFQPRPLNSVPPNSLPQ